MTRLRKPDWIKIHCHSDARFSLVHEAIRRNGLHTICSSGRCPNMWECWNRGTATLMILGDICTRSCRFCNTTTGRPLPPDPDEPFRLAAAIAKMQLKHVVLTSVDRDDLPDRGAAHWAACIRAAKEENPGISIEVLIPDFDARPELIDLVIAESPDTIAHNLETVRRLTPKIRSRARYESSLAVLAHIARYHGWAKTGIMLGLGETQDEVLELMDDARRAGCSVLTIGQYLQPSRRNIPVTAYIHPSIFEDYRRVALAKGFGQVESAPLVRSSYCSERQLPPR